MSRFALFFLTFIVISCGKKEVPEGMTRVIFKTGDDKSIQSFNLNKGLIVYGRNLDQGKVIAGAGSNIGNFVSNNSDIVLPNGHYKFIAYGFDDNGNPGNDAFHNNTLNFCGEGNGGEVVTLSGATATVNITLSNTSNGANCSEEFAGADLRTNSPPGEFKSLTINICNSSGVNSGGCAASSVTPIPSYEIRFPPYDKLKNNMDFDFSKSITGCFGSGSSVSILKKIPYRIPFHFQIRTFGSGSCTGTLLHNYDFPHGVEGVNNNLPNISKVVDGSSINIYLKE